MTIYTFPVLTKVPTPGAIDWVLKSNTQVFESPLSGAVQTVEMPGARWQVSFTFEMLGRTDSADLRAFLVGLRGRSGRFRLWNMARPNPLGVATGAPVVSGTGQSGTSLLTSGWTPSTGGILKKGDFFGVGDELKLCTATVASDAVGLALLQFEPPLRASPADATAIVTDKPTAVFRLDDDVVRWVTNAPFFDTVSIAATEAW